MTKICLATTGLILLLLGCSLPSTVQENFEGKFVYRIHTDAEPNDLSEEDSTSFLVVYAKDSMLRIENFTPIGKQIYIKHIPRKKAYILMDIGKKFAIQTLTDTTTNDLYSFEKQSGSKKIAGIKAKNIKVVDLELDTTITMNYYPEISSKYSTAFTSMPGLPVNYFLYNDNKWYNYQLISLESKPVDSDMFGIPPGYEIISMDDFIEQVSGGEREE